MAAPDDTPQKTLIQEMNRYGMFTPAPGVEGKRSRLAWGVLYDNPRITVFTNIPNDKNGVISAPMNPEIFFTLLDSIEKVALGENNNKGYIECYTAPKTDNGRQSNERILLSQVWYGKDENGIVWICLIAADRPKIKFEFKISDFHKIFKGDGTQLTESEGSVLECIAKTRGLRAAYQQLCGKLRDPNQERPNFKQKVVSGNTGQSAPGNLGFDESLF